MCRTTEALRFDAMAALLARHLRSKAARTAHDAFSLGTQLGMVKELAAKGKWRVYVNQAGIPAQAAERLIACARRFSGAPPSFFDSVGSASNLFELLALSGGDIQALMQGLDVHGLTLDRIASTGKVQLRAAIRKARESAGQPMTAPKRKGVHLSVDEEQMLRLFRQCGSKGRAALLSVAGTLVEACECHSNAGPVR
jgi:hypothetical protein